MKPYLIVLVGLQCSGKSTKAKELQKEYEDASHKCIILSSDQIRKDHPEIAQDNNKVFNKLYADMNYWLRQGDTVIIDSTAITIKARSQIFHNLKEDCYKICYIMNTPYNECLRRLNMRNKEIIINSIKDMESSLGNIYSDLNTNKISNEEAKERLNICINKLKTNLGE